MLRFSQIFSDLKTRNGGVPVASSLPDALVVRQIPPKRQSDLRFSASYTALSSDAQGNTRHNVTIYVTHAMRIGDRVGARITFRGAKGATAPARCDL